MTVITVTTANVTDNPVRPLPVVRSRIAQAAAIPGACFGQEIQENYDSAWDGIMGAGGKVTFNQTTEIPISLPKAVWTINDTEWFKVHDGLKKVSPARYLSVVRATRTSGEKVAFVNCHPVSKPRLLVPSGRWRIARWNEYHAALTAKVAKLYAAGYTVVFGGDMNKKTVPTVHRLQKVLVSSGLDHLWVVPAQGMVVTGITARPPIPVTKLMDHPILSADFSLTVAGAPIPPVVAPPVEVPVPSAARIIATAKAEVGYREGRTGGHGNNDQKFSDEVPGLEWSDGQPWCATFVSWCAMKSGATDLYPRSASCDVAGAWFKKAGRWSEYPAIGAQVFYGSPADLNHTGIVVSYTADTIQTVEGNTNDTGSREGDGVYLKTRQRRAVNVVGYGYPRFPEGIVAADPSWVRVDGVPNVKPWPIDGIDLSHHNPGRIDWAKAKAAGVRFAWHKATQGTAFRDDMYASRRAEVKAQGLPFGAYHYGHPNLSTGTAQARFFLAVAKPVKGDLRPVLDLEESGGLTIAQLDKWVEDFKDEVQRQTGLNPVLYTKFLHRSRHGCYLWTSRYNDKNVPPERGKHFSAAWDGWGILQFCNGVNGVPRRVPGINFPVDVNTLAPGFDLADLILK